MKRNQFISTNTVARFNRIFEASGFYTYDDQGQGAYIMNILNRYPGYRREVAAALSKAQNQKQPTDQLMALDDVDIQLAPEID